MSVKYEHRLGMNVTREALWEKLSDLGGWGAWNPVETQVEGRLSIGAVLSVHEVLTDGTARDFTPSVVDWVPFEQLHWIERGSILQGSVIRYFEIDSYGPGASIFTNGALFDGLLAQRAARAKRQVLRQGYEAISRAMAIAVGAKLD